MKRVLFVCLGNICRSPAAENVFNSIVKKRNIEKNFIIDSAGTADWHTGKKPDARMRKALRERGYPDNGSARPVSVEDLDKFDYVLAMDSENLQFLHDIVDLNRGESSATLELFSNYLEKDDPKNIPDPYYGEQDGFNLVIDLLEKGCENLIEKIQPAD